MSTSRLDFYPLLRKLSELGGDAEREARFLLYDDPHSPTGSPLGMRVALSIMQRVGTIWMQRCHSEEMVTHQFVEQWATMIGDWQAIVDEWRTKLAAAPAPKEVCIACNAGIRTIGNLCKPCFKARYPPDGPAEPLDCKSQDVCTDAATPGQGNWVIWECPNTDCATLCRVKTREGVPPLEKLCAYCGHPKTVDGKPHKPEGQVSVPAGAVFKDGKLTGWNGKPQTDLTDEDFAAFIAECPHHHTGPTQDTCDCPQTCNCHPCPGASGVPVPAMAVWMVYCACGRGSVGTLEAVSAWQCVYPCTNLSTPKDIWRKGDPKGNRQLTLQELPIIYNRKAKKIRSDRYACELCPVSSAKIDKGDLVRRGGKESSKSSSRRVCESCVIRFYDAYLDSMGVEPKAMSAEDIPITPKDEVIVKQPSPPEPGDHDSAPLLNDAGERTGTIMGPTSPSVSPGKVAALFDTLEDNSTEADW